MTIKEQIEKILSSYDAPEYTDELRKQVYAEDVKTAFFCGKDAQYIPSIWKDMTRGERYEVNRALSFYDAIQPYQERKGLPSAFIFDLRRGQHLACVGHVNGGADDFNSIEYRETTKDGSKEKQISLCPSAMLAIQFFGYYNAIQMHVKEIETPYNQYDDILQKDKEYLRYKCTMNDILYMYKKIRDSQRGINEEAVRIIQNSKNEEYKQKYGRLAPQIKDIFKQMDDLLNVPEKERFLFLRTEKPEEKEKAPILSRFKSYILRGVFSKERC